MLARRRAARLNRTMRASRRYLAAAVLAGAVTTATIPAGAPAGAAAVSNPGRAAASRTPVAHPAALPAVVPRATRPTAVSATPLSATAVEVTAVKTGAVKTGAVNAAAAAPPRVSLRGGALVNASNGARLWRKDVNVRRPMASITKVMAALVVLRAGHLDRKIKVTQGAVDYVRRNGASNAGLRAGDVLTAHQLLRAMLIPSGCDAAYMLATSYGPGRQAFIRKMNAEAKTLGLTSTHFSWFDGMPFPNGHSTYSTPADLVKLGERAMRFQLFRRFVAERSAHLAAAAHHHSYVWWTTNNLLGSYRGAIGIKTGNTSAGGNCLLFEARRGTRTLIGVVLHVNPSSDWPALFRTARRLLTWGFGRI
jgi:D-alanyl-D-alanine carboxypeptidase (penicillin-binding protein 5/6)